ncbi:MAG: ComF family protein [Bacteroidales bacterium]|nr:ComF family protein [Bacteroidales bacterium]MBR2747211.1 ComF family protein [Bacteroidales bacterium]
MRNLIDCLRALGDLLMPRACVVCGAPLGIHERHLCLPCAADVPYSRFWHQPHNPLADRFNAVLERHRGTEPMDYAYAVALMYYKGPYRSIPRALKYHANLSIGRFYGTLLGRHLSVAPHFVDVDLILPVPLHWTRRRSRGYNQAEVLAKAIADALRTAHPSGPPVACRTDILVRARRTRTQTRLSVEQKARNVASAFRVREGRARAILASARHVLLVDDTFTTGATLYACYAAIRPFTPARISVATLAAVEGSPSTSP